MVKFLRTDATEAGRISKIITRYALAYPHVRFSNLSEGRLNFQTPGNGNRLETLLKGDGPEAARQMLAIGALDDPVTPDIAVSGFVSEPSLHRANRSYIELLVNNRLIQDRNLSFAVIQAYHTLLPGGRYPLAAIFIDMDPTQVDVNVHPTKAEVRFREASLVFRAVQRAVHRTLYEQAPITRLQPDRDASDRGDWAARRQVLVQAGQREDLPGQIAMILYRLQQGAEDQNPTGRGEAPIPTPGLGSQPSSDARPSADTLPPLRPVGQYWRRLPDRRGAFRSLSHRSACGARAHPVRKDRQQS